MNDLQSFYNKKYSVLVGVGENQILRIIGNIEHAGK